MKKQTVNVGTGVIILDDDGGEQVLLGQRTGGTGAGQWTLPGGKLDYGESVEDCAMREVREECGLEVNTLELVSVSCEIDLEVEAQFITLGFLAWSVSGTPEVCEPDKFVRWDWFPTDNLPEPLFEPTKHVLENWLSDELISFTDLQQNTEEVEL